MTPLPFHYQCSICGKVFNADDVKKHTDEERAKPTWPGVMSWRLQTAAPQSPDPPKGAA